MVGSDAIVLFCLVLGSFVSCSCKHYNTSTGVVHALLECLLSFQAAATDAATATPGSGDNGGEVTAVRDIVQYGSYYINQCTDVLTRIVLKEVVPEDDS